MKILHLCSYFYPHVGGIEQVARDCVHALKEGNEQRLVCFNHAHGDVTEEVDGIPVYRAGSIAKVSSQSLSLSYKKILKKQFREFAPDVVLFHYPNPFLAHYLLKFLKKYSAKLVIYWHLDITKQKILGKLFNGQTLRLLARADKVLATSPIYAGYSPYLKSAAGKVEVVPLCVNKERVSYGEREQALAEQIRGANAGKKILFALGRHVPYKGMEYLVRASKLLNDEFAVFIGGKGELTEELKKLAAGDEKITFLGAVDDQTLKAYFLACDIFCFPSVTRNEAFGIALAEAMCFKKPAVTFTIEGSGVNYVSLNNETGIEVENANVGKYAEAIKTLAEDEALRKAYGEAAQKRVKENFTEEQFNKRIKSVFENE